MRFLHIADLHLGKQLNDLSLLDDQVSILQQIVDIAQNERVNAVLIAGDVYQRSSPQSEAMALFDHFITQLIRLNIKVFVISGNHDSMLRIAYLSSLIRPSGVYVSERFEGSLQSVSLHDEYGEILIHLMPFLKPSMVKRWLPTEKIQSYQDAIAAVLKHSPVDCTKRNILLCHQFVTGAETSDSEEKAVGGLDNIDASLFDAFDYVALGHLHKPQKMVRDTLRYAGSPLKYSFSEVNHQKSVTILDLFEKGEYQLKEVSLHPLHDMRLVEGELDEVLNLSYSEDYVWVTLRDELVPPDAKISIRTVFPNLMKFTVSNSKTKYDIDVLAKDSMENKDLPTLFSDFYRLQNNDQAPSNAHMRELEKLLKELEDERNETP